MGFQFNHVGGGTKTRRPITLHMKYNSACVQPNCFLLTEDFGEQEVSLEELQVCKLLFWVETWSTLLEILLCPAKHTTFFHTSWLFTQ